MPWLRLKASTGALLRSESIDKCGSANKGHHLYILSASAPQSRNFGCESDFMTFVGYLLRKYWEMPI
jgi:hypothetical protein